MSEKELSKYYHLVQEVIELSESIEELLKTGGLSGIKYREVDVMSSAINNSIQDKLDKLMDKWKERRVSALEEYIKIEEYIETVEEPEIRRIMRHRFLNLKSWKEIDKLMFYGTDYAKKKYYKYRKKYPTLSQ